MPHRCQPFIAAAVLVCLTSGLLHADITNWQSGETIPGTEGITPGPGVQLDQLNLEYAELSELDLKEANFEQSNLAYASMQHSSLRGSRLADANLNGANLVYADLFSSTLTNANLTDAVVTQTSFWSTTSNGFTKEQLYSTASYMEKNLQGVRLGANDLTGWDFSGQNLANATLARSNLTNANLSDANLINASLTSSRLTNANFSGANLANAVLLSATLADANLAGANLRNAILNEADLAHATFSADTVYNQWTTLPDGAEELTFIMSAAGDFDGIDGLAVTDVDLLSEQIGGRCHDLRRLSSPYLYLICRKFNLNDDWAVNQEDLRVWVNDLKGTYFGDANLDGQFNSSDFVQVFQAGKYETGELAGWSEGDWNGDQRCDSSDFIAAFQDGGYEKGARAAVAAVPEPSSWILLTLALVGIGRIRRTTRVRGGLRAV